MSRWYRAYEGTVTDPKLGEAALVAACSKSVAIAVWHAILESAASTQDGGRFDTTARRVAVTIGEPVASIEAVFAALDELGMARNGFVTAWQRRQFESDSSTDRSKKHRERRRNGDATLQNAEATPPDTEAKTEKEEEDDAAAAAEIADDFEDPPAKPLSALDRLWIEGIPTLEMMGIPPAKARPMVGKWLKQADNAPITVLDAIQRARDHSVVDPIPWITRSISQGQKNDQQRSSGLSAAFDRLEARISRRTDPDAFEDDGMHGFDPGDGMPGFAGRLL